MVYNCIMYKVIEFIQKHSTRNKYFILTTCRKYVTKPYGDNFNTFYIINTYIFKHFKIQIQFLSVNSKIYYLKNYIKNAKKPNIVMLL